jgi:sensor histidine kinase YesM
MAQDTTITIYRGMLDSNDGFISLADMNGWIFKQGHDTTWAKKDINTTDWKKIKPIQLSDEMVDKNGKFEGWFRIKIKLDTSFRDLPLDLDLEVWGASEIYADGKLLTTFGSTGENGKPFKEHNSRADFPPAFTIERGNEHILAIHYVDFLSPIPPGHLKSKHNLAYFLVIMYAQWAEDYFLDTFFLNNYYRAVWLSINVILCLLFWLLAFQNRTEKNLFYIAVTSTAVLAYIYFTTYTWSGRTSYIANNLAHVFSPILESVAVICTIVIMLRVFRRRVNLLSRIFMGAILICGVIQVCGVFELCSINPLMAILKVAIAVFFYIYYIVTSWKTLKGAQWAVVAGFLAALFFGLLLNMIIEFRPHVFDSVNQIFLSGVFLSIPLSLLAYVALRFKEIIREVWDNSQQVIQLSEEKKQQALNQQKILQEEVNRQTGELRNTLENLKSTQGQLIAEKEAKLLADFNQKFSESELKALRAQMNPHFVFNILNTIESYALDNDKKAASVMIQKFSRLTRLVLENSMNQLVPFQNDWRSLQLYIELEQMRYADKFMVQYNIEEEIMEADYLIPPMIIQPFVENAILHGLRNKSNGCGTLNLSASLQNEYMIVQVEDNGIGRIKSATLKANNPIQKNSLGIKVTQDRISIFNNLNQDRKASIEIEDLNEGTRVVIRLPFVNQFKFFSFK